MSPSIVLNFAKVRQRVLFGAAVLACLTAMSPAMAQDQSRNLNGASVDKLMSDAQKAVKSGNYRLALVQLRNAVSAAPHNGAARAQLGMALNALQDKSAAERELRQARKDGAPELLVLPPLFEVMLSRNEYQLILDQFPDPGMGVNRPAAADILKARALAFQSLKKPSDAIAAMDRSLALRRDSNGLQTRARLAFFQNNVPEATKYIDEAIVKSDTPSALIFKVGMLMSANQQAAALEQVNQLLAKFPDNAQARFTRVEIYLSLKQNDKAKAESDELIIKYPNSPMATYYRALLLARSGDAKGAWNIAQNLSEEFRDSQPRFSIVLAQLADNAGNRDVAAAILSRGLLNHPDQQPMRFALAAIRLKQNNAKDALNVLAPVKDSSDPQVLELIANTYIALHRNAEALEALNKLDAIGSNGAGIKRSIAVLEIQMGRSEEGIKILTQLASKDPTNLSLIDPLINGLTQTQRFPEALAITDRLAADVKKRSMALTYRGGILMLKHDIAGAQLAFDKAIQIEPRGVAPLFARAQFLASTQRLSEAKRDLQTILSIDRNYLPAIMKQAEIALQQNDDQTVRATLNRAIAVAPTDAGPRVALMRYLISRQKYADALGVANSLLKLQPNSTDGLAILGQAQLALHQSKESISTYRRLISLLPTDSAPQVFLGNALFAAGDSVGAGKALETAIKLNPNSTAVRGVQINLMLRQGSSDAAVTAATSFHSSHPSSDSDLLLADTLFKTGHRDGAIAVLNKSLSDHPNSAVLLRLVRSANEVGDRKRASDLLSNWLVHKPDDTVIRLEYAGMLMQRQDNTAAISEYQAVLKQDPNSVVALNNMGWLVQVSDPKRAVSMLTLAQKLAPNSSDIADTLGWVKLQQKDMPGALAALDKAHALAPQDGEITYHLVVALDANGQRNKARPLLGTLLKSGLKFKDLPAANKLAAAWH